MAGTDDHLIFAPETPKPVSTNQVPWHVLVIDDDEQVHQATRLVLHQFSYDNRPVTLHHAYSGKEARELLVHQPDIACLLLDVVMESDDAGLKLVKQIRNEMDNHKVRIILRTGQPGYAPELQVIRDYEINDYKEKSQLTHTQLITTLIAALRDYDQLDKISANEQIFKDLIDFSSQLFAQRSVQSVASTTLARMRKQLPLAPSSVLVTLDRNMHCDEVLAGMLQNKESIEILCQEIGLVSRPIIDSDQALILIPFEGGKHICCYFAFNGPLSDGQRQLLQMLVVQLTAAFRNAHLFTQTERQAFFDNLTGLPNRTHLMQLIASELHDQKQPTLILVDIDKFQTINDGLGYERGNELLLSVAERLRTQLPEGSHLSRLGSDQFGILCSDIDHQTLVELLNRLTKLLRRTYFVSDSEISTSVSSGAVHQCVATNASGVIEQANTALKQAKRTNPGLYCLFKKEMSERQVQRINLIRNLRSAFDKHQFMLVYQPQWDIQSGQTVSMETFIRWQRDDELISPAEFIPAAEDSGLIVHIGEWIIETACRDLRMMLNRGIPPVRLAINISVRQLKEERFTYNLEQALERYQLSPDQIELEVIESVMINDGDEITILRELRNKGFHISIDDFGTGYSSLSYLQHLPVDRLKIDRSFIWQMDDQADKQTHNGEDRGRNIVSMIIKVAHEMGMDVVAEGVETESQRKALQQLGCDIGQGFIFSKPVTRKEIEAFLLKHPH